MDNVDVTCFWLSVGGRLLTTSDRRRAKKCDITWVESNKINQTQDRDTEKKKKDKKKCRRRRGIT